MPYNSIIDRTNDAAALIPEDVSKEIIEALPQKSAALRLFRHKTMTRGQQRIPVLSLLPSAYWVTGDTGLKQTTEQQWANVYLYAEEIAAIVPIPKNVLNDVDYDLWTEIKPNLEEAIAQVLDDAVFFGTNKPASWPAAIVPQAVTASNQVVAGTSSVDTAEDINQVLAAIEADGFVPNGGMARIQFRSFLRGIRDTSKGFLYPSSRGMVGLKANEVDLEEADLYGLPVMLSRMGFSSFATGAANYSAVFGDFTQGFIGIRQDIEFTISEEAVITDGTGAIVFNLFQQDMVALRATARFGYAVPNPVTRMQGTAGSRWPFGVLKQRASTGGE